MKGWGSEMRKGAEPVEYAHEWVIAVHNWAIPIGTLVLFVEYTLELLERIEEAVHH